MTGYSSIRVQEYYGGCPAICPNYNEVVISVNSFHDASLGSTKWVVSFGTPYSDASSPSYSATDYQFLVNEWQLKHSKEHDIRLIVEKENRLLKAFIAKNDLNGEWERSIEEEKIKKEIILSMPDPACEPVCDWEDTGPAHPSLSR